MSIFFRFHSIRGSEWAIYFRNLVLNRDSVWGIVNSISDSWPKLLSLWQAMCGYHRQQLCTLRCSELHTVRQDSSHWNFWECTRSIWSYCGHHHVVSSYLASSYSLRSTVVFQLLLYLQSANGGNGTPRFKWVWIKYALLVHFGQTSMNQKADVNRLLNHWSI